MPTALLFLCLNHLKLYLAPALKKEPLVVADIGVYSTYLEFGYHGRLVGVSVRGSYPGSQIVLKFLTFELC